MINSNFASDQDDRKSIFGYIFILRRGTIIWVSKKQTYVAHPTMEAEFIAYSTLATKTVWVKQSLENLELDQMSNNKVMLLCDNSKVLQLLKMVKVEPREKHIELKYRYILDTIQRDKLHVNYIPTKEMLIDFLTTIYIKNFRKYIHAMGLRAY